MGPLVSSPKAYLVARLLLLSVVSASGRHIMRSGRTREPNLCRVIRIVVRPTPSVAASHAPRPRDGTSLPKSCSALR